MKQIESRLRRIEAILSPQKKTVLILDELTDELESWIEVNGTKSLIPPDTNVEKFIHDKIKLVKGIHICTLSLSKVLAKKMRYEFNRAFEK